ncbi:MAG: PAS domain S-box protein [Rhodospirillales bacterium]|nr:PAS domain S-box protein [Rhodospirillales bacterium]MBO6786765.1 PAS domain S-box protein [Rhodospirillales bacterium]
MDRIDQNANVRRALRRFPVIAMLGVTLSSLVIAVGVIAVGVLYSVGLDDKKNSLLAIASNAASLIDTAVSIESRTETFTEDGATELTAVRIARSAFEKFEGTGASGSVLIAHRNGDKVTVLYQEVFGHGHSHDTAVKNTKTYILGNDGLRGPILEALKGNTGTTITDHQGESVIAAYAPIPSRKLALVIEAHSYDFSAPFISAAIKTLIIGVVLAGIGVYLVYLQTVPVIIRAQQSESRFKGFSDTATEWFWETGPNLRFKAMGKGGRLGAEEDTDRYLGQSRFDITIEDTNTEKWRRHHADLEARRPFENFTYRAVLSGEVRTLSVTGLPVFDDSGEFLGYQGTGRDITDLVEDKRRIEEAEERLRFAFESITMAVIVIDERGRIESFNPHAEKVFGYKADEVVGMNVSMLMPEPDRSGHDDYIRNYINGGKPAVIGIGREVTGLRKNGHEFPMHLGVGEMTLRGERHFVGSINDLSDAKALEQQLRRAQKMEAIGQLTGGIAHDFNNLLGIIIGNLDLVQSKLDANDKNLQRIERSIKAAERGAALTGRLLNFSRQKAESTEIIDVNQVIEDLRELIQRSITSGVEIELLLGNVLVPVNINRSDFEDALINLVINARDAMPEGGVLTIETKISRIDEHSNPTAQQLPTGDYLEVAVSDNGTGMSEDVLNHVFDPFFTTKKEGKGTGLGMSMVYGFVKRSEGAISIYTEPNIGTTIKIYLPFARQSELATEVSNYIAGEDQEVRGGTESILIVDDEPDLAEVAKTILDDLGYTTTAVMDGASALEILENDRKVDLLLSDVIMPGMNGYELADTALKHHPHLRVLLTSGYTGKTSINNRKAGAKYPLLRKPYSNRNVALEVRRVLDADAPPGK